MKDKRRLPIRTLVEGAPRLAAGLWLGALTAAIPTAVSAQVASVPAAEVSVNSEVERYLRALQVSGMVDPYPWSLRSFLSEEIEALQPDDGAGPWAESLQMQWEDERGISVDLLPPSLEFIYNSHFPHGSNDGAVWAGRGVTGVAEAGVAVRYGMFSAVLRPVWFHAQNRAFPLARHSAEGREFADPRRPTNIDVPQRFGDASYSRIDPGQSSVQLALPWVAVGASTANQHWGPAREYPILLGSNAPGFIHVFVGTTRPLDLWAGHLHGRVLWGRLDQSDYSPMEDETRRVGTGLALVFLPRGVPGLELGVARFHHKVWPEGGISADEILQPFENPFTGNEGADASRNQLASVFVRWLLPRSGLEVYGEFGREDYNEDFRDLMLEPDHDSAYTLGLLKTWPLGSRHLLATGVEVMDAQVTHLERVRGQTPLYPHSQTRQGHTQRGQFLGSPAVYGGAGTAVLIDFYHPDGRVSARWSRELRNRRVERATADSEPRDLIDSMQEFRLEGVQRWGQWEVDAGIGAVYNFNRHFDGDVLNLVTQLGARWRW